MENIFKQIKNEHEVLLISHENPDIDAISSLISVSLYLKYRGVEKVYCLKNGPVPTGIDFLAKDFLFFHEWQDKFSPEFIFILDCEKISRIGQAYEEKLLKIKDGAKVINIDHHKTNILFGDVNIVDEKSSSTCELLAQNIIDDSNDPKLATALLAGIVSDTGRFRYSNTTEKTLRIVSTLVGLGADLFSVNENVERNLLLEGIILWGEVLSRAQEIKNKKVIWSSLSAEQYTRTENIQEVAGSDLINQLMRSRHAELAILFVDQGDGNIRVSLRSRPPIDSSIVAKNFNGGGHVRASGCKILGKLEDAEKAVIKFISENYSVLETG